MSQSNYTYTVTLPTSPRYMAKREPNAFPNHKDLVFREYTQNSMDARIRENVRIKISQIKVNIEDIPGFDDFVKPDGFYSRLKKSEEQTNRNEETSVDNSTWIEQFEKCCKRGWVWGLTVSDFGASGLSDPYVDKSDIDAFLRSGYHALLGSLGMSVKEEGAGGCHGYGGKKSIEEVAKIGFAVRTLNVAGESAFTVRYLLPSSIYLDEEDTWSTLEATIDENGIPYPNINELDNVFGESRSEVGTDIVMFSFDPFIENANELFGAVSNGALNAYPLSVSDDNLNIEIRYNGKTFDICSVTLWNKVQKIYNAYRAEQAKFSDGREQFVNAYTIMKAYEHGKTKTRRLAPRSGTPERSVLTFYVAKGCMTENDETGPYVPILRGKDDKFAFYIGDLSTTYPSFEDAILLIANLTKEDTAELQHGGEDLFHRKLDPKNKIVDKIRDNMQKAIGSFFKKETGERLSVLNVGRLLGQNGDGNLKSEDRDPNVATDFIKKNSNNKKKKKKNDYASSNEEELGCGKKKLKPKKPEPDPDPEPNPNPKPGPENNDDTPTSGEKPSNQPGLVIPDDSGDQLNKVPNMKPAPGESRYVIAPMGKVIYKPKTSGKIAIRLLRGMYGRDKSNDKPEYLHFKSAYDINDPNCFNLANDVNIVCDVEANKRYEYSVVLVEDRPDSLEAEVWRVS